MTTGVSTHARAQSRQGRTDVDLLAQAVVDDLDEAHDVRMMQLLHDCDLLADARLGAAEAVVRWWVWRRGRGRKCCTT